MKQTKIEYIRELDAGFTATYNRIKQVINNQPSVYAEYITSMQTLIKEIGELGISIQVGEMRNKRLLDIHLSKEQNFPSNKEVKPSKHLSKSRIDAYSIYKKENNQ